MRILYFSDDYSPHDYRFLSALAKTRHDVSFLRLERAARQTEDRPVPAEIAQLNWAGGNRRFRWRDVPELNLGLRRVIESIKPDLIHAGPVQTCAFLAVLSGFRPVLTMSWGFDLMQDAERNPWWRWVTRYTLRRSTWFTSDAEVTRDRAVACGMKLDRTAVFPWGVDLKLFRPSPPARSDTAPARRNKTALRRLRTSALQKDFVVLCNRSWEPRYGVDVLARGFVMAAARNPRLSLTLLGAGSQARRIQRILREGSGHGRVVFGGQVPYSALPRWYHTADLFVSPSHIDGSSVSLMEALACGVPCLVSDIPANKEWIRDGQNGWLFPDGNAEALAEKLVSIAADRRQLTQIGRAARKTAEERADWNKNFEVLLGLYDRAARLTQGMR